MPSMKVKIGIAGLAYCHLHRITAPDRGELQTLFLHADSRHKLRLHINRDNSVPQEEHYNIPENSVITLNAVNSVTVPFTEGEDLNSIVNIDRLHHPTNNLPFKPKNMELSYLSIPDALCYTQEIPSTTYDFWRINGNTKNFEKNEPIGTVLGVDFEVNGEPGNEGYLEFNFSKMPTVRVDYEADTEVKVLFENDCPDSVCFSDFRYYYQILESGGTEFEEMPPFPPFAGGHPVDTEAACNPVRGDPTDCTPFGYFHGLC